MGAILSPALAIAGVTFVVNSSGLYDALYVVLPVLLLEVAVVSVVILRRSEPNRSVAVEVRPRSPKRSAHD